MSHDWRLRSDWASESPLSAQSHCWFYHVVAQILFPLFRIAQKREEAVAREVMKKIADDKKMNKKEKDERFGVWANSVEPD